MRIAVGTLLCAIVCSLSALAQTDVLTEHNDLARTGANTHETELTPATVSPTTFGLLFKRILDDQVYSQPLLVTHLTMGGGVHDVVFLTTVNNSVYAFDANDPDATWPLWHVNFGTPPSAYDAAFGCDNINGSMGIIGTPVIDRHTNTLYVVALTRTGSGPATHYEQRLHALEISTGTDLPSSPKEIEAPQFDPIQENQRPALALANGKVYIGYASHCDKEPYHGFLLAYDAKTLAQTAVFNATPTGTEAAIWQSGQAPAVDPSGNLYVITGNGSWDGVQNFSESFLKLSPDLKLLDWFTPSNHLALDADDADLGSAGATLIPNTHQVIGGGKEGILFSLDTNHLGHLGEEHALQHFRFTTSHLHNIVFWQSHTSGPVLYTWGQRDRLRQYRIAGAKIEETPTATRDEVNEGHPGAMLSLSANGDKDGILWAAIHATGDSWNETRPGILHAYATGDIRHELWNSLQNPARDDCAGYSKMAPPTIANGKVYLASLGTQNIGTGQFCVYGLLPAAGPKPGIPANVHVRREGHHVTLDWDPVPAARFYRLLRQSSFDKVPRLVALGLVTTTYHEVGPRPGETVTYRVIAVGTNGPSEDSAVVSITVTPEEAPTMK
jgi:hypothetical protein